MLRKRARRWRSSEEEFNPLSSLANLADVMFVFSVGLIVALVSAWHVQPLPGESAKPRQMKVVDVKQGKEMKDLPQLDSGTGTGFEEMGTVYKDPKTGKLIMVHPSEGGQ